MGKLSIEDHLVVFFDGDCTICNRFIHFILRNIKESSSFLFCSQNHPSFPEFLGTFGYNLKEFDSIVVYFEGQLFFSSKALSIILKQLVRPWSYLSLFLGMIPFCISDFFYKIFARYRRCIGKYFKKSCPILPKEWQKFFITNECSYFLPRNGS
jgi:predicted DCC family thiol-disulfide oxidoreductase YuxK